MKYKGLIIKIEKDPYVEGGKIYTIIKDNIYVTSYPSLNLSKEFIRYFNHYFYDLDYAFNEAVNKVISIIG